MPSQFKKFVQTDYFFLLIILLVSAAIMLPVYFKGIPFGYDLPHHYQCAMTFVESIQNGDWYPSWSLNRNFGFGGMESRLYPPISHYSLALAYLIFRNWHFASWFTFTFYTFIGGLGVYLWAKEYLPSKQAVFAGAIYILLPYHLNQLYNTFFYAEYVGSCVLPFSFLFLSRVCRRGKSLDVIGLMISYSVLVLTHLPLTVIGSICLAVYGLTLLKRELLISQIAKLSISVIGALAASSFFWTKVLLERNLMAKTSIYEDPWLDYRLHFLLTPIQTFEGELRERIFETATFYYDLMLLAAVVLAISCTIPFFFLEKRSRFSMKGLWLLFGISVFLILPFSKFVWDAIPFLQEVQFPWRWVAVVCIFASILAASRINFLIDWFRDKKLRPFALIICGFILGVITFSLSQIVRQAPHIEVEITEKMMEKNAQDIGFTFWWTVWTRKAAFDNKEKVTAPNRDIQIQNWTATNREFTISEGNAEEIRIATLYHPNWKAEVNKIPVEIKPDENGAILIPISSENTSVNLVFQEPLQIRLGREISGAVWILLVLSLMFFGIKERSLPSKFIKPNQINIF